MTPITLPMVDNNVFIDATSLNKFTTCPRSFEYYFIRKREPTGRRSALEAGAIFHRVLELRRLLEGTEPLDNIELKQELLISFCYSGYNPDSTSLGTLFPILCTLHPELNDMSETDIVAYLKEHYQGFTPEVDDFRTQQHLITVCRQYNMHYEVEPFTVLRTPDGQPIVEASFAEPIITLELPGHPNPITFNWTGRIDLPTLWPGNELWNMDLKTGTRDSGFDEWANNQAQIGYLWALRRTTGLTPRGFIIDKVLWRAPTRTGKGTEFQRHKESIVPERIDEWCNNTIEIIKNIVHTGISNYWPMHSEQHCSGKYGVCPYLDVCKLAPQGRDMLLDTPAFYKPVTWSPLRK